MTNYIITVKQSDVSTPRLYKTHCDHEPTIDELIELGAVIVLARQDKVTVDAVSSELYAAVSAEWIRP